MCYNPFTISLLLEALGTPTDWTCWICWVCALVLRVYEYKGLFKMKSEWTHFLFKCPWWWGLGSGWSWDPESVWNPYRVLEPQLPQSSPLSGGAALLWCVTRRSVSKMTIWSSHPLVHSWLTLVLLGLGQDEASPGELGHGRARVPEPSAAACQDALEGAGGEGSGGLGPRV